MNFIKINKYLTIFLVFFVTILIFIFYHQINVGYAKESWEITEWLINYEGGFVRRGLWGEFILNFYKYSGVSPYITILFLSASFYLGFLFFFIKLYFKKGYPLFILPFVFFLGNPLINNFWVRKDVLLVIIFSLILYFLNKKTVTKVIFINLLLIVGLLTHEAIGFFGFPILLLLFYKDNLTRLALTKIKSVIFTFIQLLPSLLVFVSCLYFKGSTDISNIIWNSWKFIEFPIQMANSSSAAPAAIHGLAMTLKEGLGVSLSLIFNFNGGIYGPIAWIIIISLIYYLLTNLDKFNIKNNTFFNKRNISNILILQFLSVIPLFILGWDYSRWIFYWVISSFLVILLLPEEKISNLFPLLISNLSLKINKILSSIFDRNRKAVYFIIFFLGVPGYSWVLSDFLITTPLGIIIHELFSIQIISFIKQLII